MNWIGVEGSDSHRRTSGGGVPANIYIYIYIFFLLTISSFGQEYVNFGWTYVKNSFKRIFPISLTWFFHKLNFLIPTADFALLPPHYHQPSYSFGDGDVTRHRYLHERTTTLPKTWGVDFSCTTEPWRTSETSLFISRYGVTFQKTYILSNIPVRTRSPA